MARFAELVERFLFRPDEEVGAFLDLAPQVDDTAPAVAEETPEEFLAFELEHET
jgi:hypothetical protein